MSKTRKGKSSPFLHAVKYCFVLSWTASAFYTAARILIIIFSVVFPFISIYLTKDFLNYLSISDAADSSFPHAIFLLILIILVGFCNSIVGRISQYFFAVHDEKISNKIRTDIMNQSMSIDMQYFDAPNFWDMFNAVNRDSAILSKITWNLFYSISSIMSCISAFVLLINQDIFFSLIISISILPNAVITQKYTKSLYTWQLGQNNNERKMYYLQAMASDRAHAPDIRLYNIKNFIVDRYSNIWNLIYTNKKRLQKQNLILLVVTSIIPEVCVLFFLITIAKGVFYGTSPIGDYTLYAGLAAALVSSMHAAIGSSAEIYDDRLKVETIEKFKKYSNSVQDSGDLEITGEIKIEFEKVKFKYPSTNEYVLEDLSFIINPMEKVCLIGINGAGKSTIIKLLLRFYDVSDGIIKINDIDIKQYKIESLRRAFSTYFQQAINYAFSLRENITISDLSFYDFNDNKAIDALTKAGADELLRNKWNSLDVHLYKIFDQSGIEPSDGQSQKIALARAIYRSCKCIILDEPSSALDAYSELELYNSIKILWENKTAIFISHRLSIVHFADEILLLDNGKISEQGTHSQLIKANGKYAKMYRMQAEKYMT